MKVIDLLSIINKLSKILDMYKSESLEKMLDSIYHDLKDFRKIKNKIILDEKDEKDEKESINYKELIEVLKGKNREEIIEALEKMSKANIMILLNEIGLKVKRDSNKIQIINEIVNHFSYMQLNEKMGERNQSSF